MASDKNLLQGVKLHLVENTDDVANFMTWLGRSRSVLAVDTETEGFNPYKDKIRLIQFGDTQEGWAMSWDDWKGVALEALEKYRGQYTYHNIAFDGRFIELNSRYRIPKDRAHDTMLMWHIKNPLGSGALKSLAAQQVDARAQAGQTLLDEAFHKHGWNWKTVPINFPAYWNYSALDPVLTAHLWEQAIVDCGPGGAYERVYQLEMAARHICSAMERNGAPIDVEYSIQMQHKLTEFVQQVKAWCRASHGISMGSSIQLADRFEELGATIDDLTPTGAKKMDKYQLELLSHHPEPLVAELAIQTLEMKKAEKIASSYFKNFVEQHIDGIIHPSIRTLGARTGRMSISDPALQQLPKGSSAVRRAFIPSEGNSLLSCDFSQIEMRLMAHFSEDPQLIQAFLDADRSGGDFFVSIGKDVYSDPSFSKDDPRRGLIKNTLYGKAYGAGARKMSESAGVPESTMRAVISRLDATYPGIRGFMAKIEDMGVRRERETGQGFVETPFGRRLPCDKGKVYTLTNYLIQSHAAEIFKEALVRLDLAGYTDAMMLPVHDEVVFNMPNSEVASALREIPELMADLEGYSVPLTTEIDGPLANWGVKYEVKK